jgi:nicotinamide mononucleotide transporter
MIVVIDWFTDNYIELFGAVTGIIYVFLEIRQNLWLWPVGIATSAVYIYIFFTGKLYADMSLQVYYLIISILGWYWWIKGSGLRAQDAGQEKGDVVNAGPELRVSRLKFNTGIILAAVLVILYGIMWFILEHLTDSPVPEWDAFITSLSVIATWMLARKILEHWYLWIVVNIVAVILFLTRGLYPTVILYAVYCAMSFIGLREWKKSINRKDC